MAILFTIVGLILLIAGGAGLYLTYTNYELAAIEWINGSLTYGVFVILGLAAIIIVTLTPRET